MSATSPIDLDSGPRLKAWLTARPRPIAIAREAGCSKQFVDSVLAGRAKPSERIIRACRELGVPDEVFARRQESAA